MRCGGAVVDEGEGRRVLGWCWERGSSEDAGSEVVNGAAAAAAAVWCVSAVEVASLGMSFVLRRFVGRGRAFQSRYSVRHDCSRLVMTLCQC